MSNSEEELTEKLREAIHQINNGLTIISGLVYFTGRPIDPEKLEVIERHSEMAKDGIRRIVSAMKDLRKQGDSDGQDEE